jgi:hypothetical protein
MSQHCAAMLAQFPGAQSAVSEVLCVWLMHATAPSPNLLEPPSSTATSNHSVGTCEGATLGTALGDALGDALGEAVGDALGDVLGEALGDKSGDALGDKLGEMVVVPAQALPSVLGVMLRQPFHAVEVPPQSCSERGTTPRHGPIPPRLLVASQSARAARWSVLEMPAKVHGPVVVPQVHPPQGSMVGDVLGDALGDVVTLGPGWHASRTVSESPLKFTTMFRWLAASYVTARASSLRQSWCSVN